ncbi:hypothetical protein [Tenacibaculum discolor]|uniref:hypothetical protein n=1 Tax=Tenacibaculum discolor TaxID=361581 RepID=UPI000EB1B886|nr:hypothetical protein [Tenacibaculum discolor]RLK07723.1 hypothetical protein C8N27_0063 [Tenacibaculum discolor]
MRILKLILCLLLLNSCNKKTENPILVDKSIITEIDSIVEIKQYGNHSIGQLNFNIRDIKNANEFNNDKSSDLFSFLKTQRDLNMKFIKSVCNCNLSNDTIKIIGGQGYTGGVGFFLKIYKDSISGKVSLLTTKKVYSKSKEEKDLFDNINLLTDEIKLTITKPIEYKVNETIKGKIYLKTEPFYQKNIKGEIKKIVPSFDIIFTCKLQQNNLQ